MAALNVRRVRRRASKVHGKTRENEKLILVTGSAVTGLLLRMMKADIFIIHDRNRTIAKAFQVSYDSA